MANCEKSIFISSCYICSGSGASPEIMWNRGWQKKCASFQNNLRCTRNRRRHSWRIFWTLTGWEETYRRTQENYVFDQPRDSTLFCFKPIPVGFGPMGEDFCGTILYPNSIRDLINFALRDCVAQNIPVRRCRNCGRYFPIIGRVTAEYCSRPQPSGKLRRNIAPVRKWTAGQKKDLVFQEYRREYKRHFAWIKAGKISEEQFAVWAKRAKTKKRDCDAEKISLDEFKA